MKKYTLVFGLMVVLCCSSLLFACVHVITGSLSTSDAGTCKITVEGIDYPTCDICGDLTTPSCADISCTSGTATQDGCEWTLTGVGTYEFKATVSCEFNSGDITGSFEETVCTKDETIEVDKCEDTSTEATVKNDTCHTITAAGFDTSIFNISDPSSIDSGDSLTVGIKGEPGLLSDSDIAQTVTFSSTEDGDVCIVSIEESDTSDCVTTCSPPSMSPTSASGSPLPGSNSGGCGSGGCSGGIGTKPYKNMQANIALYEKDALANQAQFLSKEGTSRDGTNVKAKINLGSGWISPHQRSGWSVEEYSGTDGGTVTGFTVTDASDNIYYYYELGTEIPDFPKLQRVDRKTGEGPNDVETIDYEYTSGKLDYQQDESGNKIVYSYNSTSGRLEKLEFIPYEQSAARTLEFTYSDEGMLENADCSSCSNAGYTYVPTTQEVYDPVNDEGIPWRYYVTKVKDVDDNIIEEYTYNTDDRITEHNLGSLSNKLVVSKWVHTEDQGALETERRDYIDSTSYRVTIYNYDADGSLSDFIKFHQLQTDTTYPSDPGDYSIIRYSEDTEENLKITEYDSGLKDVKELDANGWLYKRYKEDSTTTLDIAEYSYTSHTNSNDESRYMLDWQENAHGGKTEYTYDDNFNMTNMLSPTITSGVTDNLPGQTDSRTVYDTLKRVKYQMHKNSNGNWVGRDYVYDSSNGKLDKTKDGVVFTLNDEALPTWTVNTADDTNAVVTDYTYTVFGELEKTALLDGVNERNIQKSFYDSKGKKIGEAKLLNSTDATSATKYTYNDDNFLVIKSVVKEADKFDVSDLENDLNDVTFTADTNGKVTVTAGALELSWIHTVYLYDEYGRKEFMIEDANYATETRQHLKTEYLYNHQGEVKEVKYPSGKVVQTTRDGRGLVKEEKTGYDGGSTFITVEYTYDGDGNLKTRTEPHPDGDGSEIRTVYTYDGFGRSRGTHTEKVPE